MTMNIWKHCVLENDIQRQTLLKLLLRLIYFEEYFDSDSNSFAIPAVINTEGIYIELSGFSTLLSHRTQTLHVIFFLEKY